MIKSILVPFDGSEHAETALNYGIQLGRLDQARIDGLFVIDIRNFFQPPTTPLAVEALLPDTGNIELNFNLELQKEMVKTGESILKTFEDLCDRGGVRRGRTFLETGLIAPTICEKGKTADLIILGKEGLFEETEASETSTTQALDKFLGPVVAEVMKTAIRPVLVVPREYREIKRILIAYDGNEAASRALQIVAYLGAVGDFDLKILVVTDSPSEGRKIGREAEDYLQAYELEPHLLIEEGNPIEKILAVAGRETIDLIAMGAFGKSKIRELFLGSTTEAIVKEADCPVLLHR
jgi:nucleotide-binding universal stress UspA family protein